MKLDRRRFLLCTTAGHGAGSAAWFLGRYSQPKTVQRTAWALGSDVSFTVVGLNETSANRAIDAALAEIETVEQTMSIYRSDSQLSELNRERVLRQPHPYLITVLQMAGQTAQQTGGAFDVTVQPLWQLNSAAKRNNTIASDADLATAMTKIDWRKVQVTPGEVRLLEPVEAITLNGVAQGFALDRAIAALKANGAVNALIDTGEISNLGTKAVNDPWTTGIQHPRVSDAYVAVADLDGRALATSGDYETSFSADLARNHIFDPRTGESPRELASVTIVAPTGLQADALSTAAMVLGKERTLALVARLPQVDALLVDKAGEVFSTPGFPQANLS
jgi:thiamine biosynthesis lipoprotein